VGISYPLPEQLAQHSGLDSLRYRARYYAYIRIRIRIILVYLVGSRIVPLRVDKEVLEVVDRLVRLGVFSSRSEALRELIKIGIRSYERLARIAQGVEKLLEMERREGRIPVRLDGSLKLLLEERRQG